MGEQRSEVKLERSHGQEEGRSIYGGGVGG